MTTDDDTRCQTCWSWHDSPTCESVTDKQARINRELADTIAQHITAERWNEP